MKPPLEQLKVRFGYLCDLYFATLDRAKTCDDLNERKCLIQEMRALTAEAKSLALEYRIVSQADLQNTERAPLEGQFPIQVLPPQLSH